ncbi:MAG: acetate--CoA ligase family protein, partial [Candidatus Dormibacteraeota bacterium]|nr:acetate--CoA ligase family protein [Candidatus Dormibacteraeota bacterium]
GRRGVRYLTMITAGFRETGADGAVLEAELARRCREHGITLLGPNCLGFVNYRARIAAYALPLSPPLEPGPVAVLSQSGVMLQHFHRLAQARGLGLAATLSIGNEAIMTSDRWLEMLLERPDVLAVGALLEGLREPAAFLAAARRAAGLGKPVVVLKVGRGEAAVRSVAAHTGSLAGADAVVDAAFHQNAIVRVASIEDLVETCGVLADGRWPEGGRTAVVTTSGGTCGLLADLADGTNLELTDFAPATKARLSALLPEFGTPQNPLDTTGVVVDNPDLLAECIDAVVAEGTFAALLMNTEPPRSPGATPASTERRLAALATARARVPFFSVVVGSTASDPTDYGRDLARRHGLRFVLGLEAGVRALDHAVAYGRARVRVLAAPPGTSEKRHAPALVRGWSGRVPEADAKRLLEAYGVAIPGEWQARDAEEAASAAAELGFPVVVKVLSPDLAHKSDAGGVRLGLRSEQEVRGACAAILAEIGERRPEARVSGFTVAVQAEPVAELIAGVHQDPQFGPVVVAGLGGILVEVLDDVSLRLPPLDEAEAEAMLLGLRGAAVLSGARGRPVADLAACSRVLVALGELALDLGPRLKALDVNPLMAMPAGQGALAADALLELS